LAGKYAKTHAKAFVKYFFGEHIGYSCQHCSCRLFTWSLWVIGRFNRQCRGAFSILPFGQHKSFDSPRVIQCTVSLIVANLAVVVTHVYRLIRNGEDIDHASYDTSGINTTRLGFGGLKRLANRASFKTHASSIRFTKSLDPQTRLDQDTRSGGETTTDTDTPAPSKTYHPLTLSTDMSDDPDRDEKTVGTWSKNDEEARISHSPAQVQGAATLEAA
jgi:hypothetical protein